MKNLDVGEGLSAVSLRLDGVVHNTVMRLILSILPKCYLFSLRPLRLCGKFMAGLF